MKPACPACGATFPIADINIAENIALCRKCGKVSKVSELVDQSYDPDLLRQPPKGAWMTPSMNGVAIGASTRSPIAFFLVPFMLVWSGGALGGIYGTQIMKGEFNLVLSLFGLPFLAGSVLFWAITLMALAGKVEVTLRGKLGTVFVGVGSLGWKRPFRLEEVQSISEELTETRSHKRGRSTSRAILLDGPKPLRFGSGLSAERRQFIIQALRAAKA